MQVDMLQEAGACLRTFLQTLLVPGKFLRREIPVEQPPDAVIVRIGTHSREPSFQGQQAANAPAQGVPDPAEGDAE